MFILYKNKNNLRLIIVFKKMLESVTGSHVDSFVHLYDRYLEIRICSNYTKSMHIYKSKFVKSKLNLYTRIAVKPRFLI